MGIFDNLFKRSKPKELSSIYDNETDKLSIVKTDTNKELRFNNIVYSKLSDNSVYTGSYWDYFTPLPALYKKPNILMIGLGGGTIAIQMLKLFPAKKLHIDAIEISENMIKLAKEFGLKESAKLAIINADGSRFVKKEKNTYDIIILDAYISDRIPNVFIQEGFIRDCFSALTNNDILAVNYALGLHALIYLEPYLSRLREYFKVYKVNPIMSGNMIIICSKALDKEKILHDITSSIKENKENGHVLREYKSMN